MLNDHELKAVSCFRAAFGGSPEELFFAPGRVNLIGEHIDYNGGCVMPCSLSIGTYGAARKRGDDTVRLVSADIGGSYTETTLSALSRLAHSPADFGAYSWAAYPLGVCAKLMEKGYALGGFELAVCGSLPRGSGLSSSASLEILACAVLDRLFSLGLDAKEAALVSLAAERDCAGVNCGIMDQFVCAAGRKAAAILLDTNSLEYRLFPFDLKEHTILIMNTKKPRRLADSKYNERRAECEEALKLINSALGTSHPDLCSVSGEELSSISAALPPLLLKRARHAVTENERTLAAAKALEEGDIALFGRLLDASHDSLRDDYEVTGRELDSIVAAARAQKGVLGARMTGAGFGGCAIALVKKDMLPEIMQGISLRYNKETGYCCELYAADTADAPFGAAKE